MSRKMSAATRAALLGWLMLGLAPVVVVGPFLWIAVASFKQPIAILSGTWSFTPTLDNYAGVLAFVFSWNEFSIALNLVSQTNATVPVVVAKFAQDYEIQHGQMAAASILATIPALVLMVFGQRFIVQGLTMGSVK